RRPCRPAHLRRAGRGGQLPGADRIGAAVPARPRHLRGHRGRHGPQRLRRGQRVRASALSATILILGTPAGHAVPASAAYSAAARASTAALAAALLVSGIFAATAKRPEPASAPTAAG